MPSPNGLRPPATWALVLAFTAVYISWGTTYLAIKIGVRDEHLPPALFGGARVFLAGALVLGVQALRGQKLRIARREWMRVGAGSIFLFVLGNGMLSVAEKSVDSGVAAVLAATTPLWMGLFAMCWPGGERLTGRGWLGLLVGLLGVPMLLWPQLRDPAAFIEDVGPLLVLGSAVSWSVGSLCLRRLRGNGSHLTGASYQMLVGGGSLTVVGLLAGEWHDLPERVTLGAAVTFVYLLIAGSLVGFVAFNWLLNHVSATKVGTHAYVNPAVAVLAGWLAGEEFTIWIAGGIAVILLGVFLVRGGERPAGSVPRPRRVAEIKSLHGEVLCGKTNV